MLRLRLRHWIPCQVSHNFLLKGRDFDHLKVHAHNAGKEFKWIEMLLFNLSRQDRDLILGLRATCMNHFVLGKQMLYVCITIALEQANNLIFLATLSHFSLV